MEQKRNICNSVAMIVMRICFSGLQEVTFRAVKQARLRKIIKFNGRKIFVSHCKGRRDCFGYFAGGNAPLNHSH